MSKRQKLSFFPLEDLPNEILLKILSLLDIKGVLQCGRTSTRLREISNDKSLWLKLNLSGRKVPYGFIEKAMQNGCEYLNLSYGSVHGLGLHGDEKSKVPWKLKYLDISQCENCVGVLQNCHFLEKLAVDCLTLTSREIDHICQNGETLQILSLERCNLSYIRTELIQRLFTKCHQLTEFNLYSAISHSAIQHDAQLCDLVKNLTPNILKLRLVIKRVKDEHVKTLVRRCRKITELNLSDTSITNDSVKSIVEHLNSLEKLDVSFTGITNLHQVKSIPTLKILHFFGHHERIKNLKLQLPQISINEDEDFFQIARPTKKVNGSIDHDWFWEIRANQQDLFPRVPRKTYHT